MGYWTEEISCLLANFWPESTLSSFQQRTFQHASLLHQSQKRRGYARKTKVDICYNLIIEGLSHYLCHIILVMMKLLYPAHIQEKRLCGHEYWTQPIMLFPQISSGFILWPSSNLGTHITFEVLSSMATLFNFAVFVNHSLFPPLVDTYLLSGVLKPALISSQRRG